MHAPIRFGGKVEIMRDDDDGLGVIRARRIHKIAHDGQNLPARNRVEIAGRLIGENHQRIIGERAGDGDALTLPARHLVRAFARVIGKAQ